MSLFNVAIALVLASVTTVDAAAAGATDWQNNDATHGNVRMGVKSSQCDDGKVGADFM